MDFVQKKINLIKKILRVLLPAINAAQQSPLSRRERARVRGNY